MTFTDTSTTEAALRKLWTHGLGYGDMEIWRYGDMEVTGVNWTFPSCFLLLFSSYWISARYKWRRHGFYHLPLEVDFPRAPDPPKGHPRAVPIGCGIYEAVRGRTSLDLFLLLFMYGYAAQEVCR